MSAIHNRMQAKGTSSRPELDGYVDKSGRFSLSMSSKVMRHFHRRTRLRGHVKREDGVTVIRGFVPGGLSREGQAVIFGALVLVAGILLTQGSAIFALAVILAGAGLTIPLTGDYHNSAILFADIKRTLGAKETPPKKTTKNRR